MPLVHPNVHDGADHDLDVDADVVVIGTGAGGAVFASELAEAGLKVVLFEKGPAYDRRDFDQREADMMHRLYEDAALRTTSDGAIAVLHASCVGGTTVVNNAICFPPPPFVLARWGKEAGLKGLSPEDLAPSVAKVEFVLNVMPIGEGELNANAKLMRLGAQRLGLGGAPFRHNRTACAQSGFCMVGCAYDRKQTMLVTYVPRALHFGARLWARAKAEHLVVRGRKVEAVEGSLRDPATGRTHRFRARARLFAVAGGAISTPLLLLASDAANRSDQVGRNLRLHPLFAAFAEFPQEVRAYEGIPQGYHVDRFLETSDGHGGFLLESIFTHPGIAAATLPGFGEPFRRMMTRLNHLASAYVQVLDAGGGRVEPGKGGAPRITYALADADRTRAREGLGHLMRIFLAAGATSVHLPAVGMPTATSPDQVDAAVGALSLAPNDIAVFSAHQMGTCRMGADPAASVLDADLRAHDLDNLVVPDASAFPTAIGVNPQITIASLATHAAKRAIARGLPG